MTGTVVIGSNVAVTAAVSHGAHWWLRLRERPFVSQPGAAFSNAG
jgi:flagellar basal body P-ring protein FlgI